MSYCDTLVVIKRPGELFCVEGIGVISVGTAENLEHAHERVLQLELLACTEVLAKLVDVHQK